MCGSQKCMEFLIWKHILIINLNLKLDVYMLQDDLLKPLGGNLK